MTRATSTSKWIRTAVLLLAVILFVPACSEQVTTPQKSASGAPQVQLSLVVGGRAVPLTRTSEVGTQPVFHVKVNDRTVITRVEYRLNDGPWTQIGLEHDATALITISSPLRGTNGRIAVRATNQLNETTEVESEFSIDAVAPEFSLFQIDGTDFLNGVIPGIELVLGQSGRVHVEAEAVDEGTGTAGISIIVDVEGELYRSAADGRLDLLLAPDDLGAGVHRVRIFAADRAGNLTRPYAFLLSIVELQQKTAPVVTIRSPADNVTVRTGAPITVILDVEQGSDGIGQTHVAVDGTELSRIDEVTFSGTAPLISGDYLITAWAFGDGVVTLRSAMAFQSLVVSDAAPVVSILSPEEDRVYGSGKPVEISLEVFDGGGGIGRVEVSLDGAPMDQIDDLTFRLDAPLGTGRYEVRAWAYNESNSQQSVVASQFIRVDASAPAVRIVGPSHGMVLPYTRTEPIAIDVEAEDYGSEISVIVIESNGSGGWIEVATIPDPANTESIGWNPQPGGHILRATATDRFGNIGNSQRIPVFVTDVAVGGPEVAVLSPTAIWMDVIPGESILFELSLQDVGDGIGPITFWLDREIITADVMPQGIAGRQVFEWSVPVGHAEGEYVLYVRVSNTAGDQARHVPIVMINVVSP